MSDTQVLAKKLGECLRVQGHKLVTAESCTGGWLGQVITAIRGSSLWYDRGFITYSNGAKQEMLGVRRETLEAWGAVSQQTAREMAEGALRHSDAQVSVAVTGIAGPDGGSTEKPVGSVWFAWAHSQAASSVCECQVFPGHREQVREQAVAYALRGLLKLCQQQT